MKLNADIVFDNLNEVIPAKIFGPRSTDFSLSRPELCVGNEKIFLCDHLYITKADRLPPRPTLEKRVTFICIGNSLQATYYKSNSCFIQLEASEDLFVVFNLVQKIFNTHDIWNEKLSEILNDNASVKEMIDCSRTIFSNPLYVVDSEFHYLGYAGYSYTDAHSSTSDTSSHQETEKFNLSLLDLGIFLEQNELSMHVREPILVNLLDSSTMNINLFDNDDYIGCLIVDYQQRSHRQSDIKLGEHLAKFLSMALQKFPSVSISNRSILRQVFQNAIEGIPIDTKQRRSIESAGVRKEFCCIKLQLGTKSARLPFGYLRNMVESTFSESIAIEYESSTVSLIELEGFRTDDGDYAEGLREQLRPFFETMDIHVGVSDAFTNLLSARYYYQQTSAALRNGILIDPSKGYYTFKDYALTELVLNSLGELPVELYFPEGIKRLIAHDAVSSVSYLETLSVYIEKNMNMAQTASSLYIHRSTLLERMARIEKDLDIDLQVPDERLKLLILLKALSIQNTISGS